MAKAPIPRKRPKAPIPRMRDEQSPSSRKADKLKVKGSGAPIPRANPKRGPRQAVEERKMNPWGKFYSGRFGASAAPPVPRARPRGMSIPGMPPELLALHEQLSANPAVGDDVLMDFMQKRGGAEGYINYLRQAAAMRNERNNARAGRANRIPIPRKNKFI